MNALANSKRKELEQHLSGDDGQVSTEERLRIAAHSPDILRTKS